MRKDIKENIALIFSHEGFLQRTIKQESTDLRKSNCKYLFVLVCYILL